MSYLEKWEHDVREVQLHARGMNLTELSANFIFNSHHSIEVSNKFFSLNGVVFTRHGSGVNFHSMLSKFMPSPTLFLDQSKFFIMWLRGIVFTPKGYYFSPNKNYHRKFSLNFLPLFSITTRPWSGCSYYYKNGLSLRL